MVEDMKSQSFLIWFCVHMISAKKETPPPNDKARLPPPYPLSAPPSTKFHIGDSAAGRARASQTYPILSHGSWLSLHLLEKPN